MWDEDVNGVVITEFEPMDEETGDIVDFGGVIIIPETIEDKPVVGISGRETDVFTFYGAEITDIILPSTLLYLDGVVFKGTQITDITIPASVEEIEFGVFDDAENLAAINVEEDNEVYSSVDGVLYDKDVTALYKVPAALDVETLEIPDTVEYIEDCAFDYNATIEKIVLGANVERFSIDCYSGAVLISDIEVPEENPYFQDFGTYVLTEDKAELVFVEPSVRNFVIPKELEDIGKGAFVFSCCLPLASVSVEDGNDTYCVVDGVLYNKDMTTLVFATEEVATEFEVPDTVESIDNFAFYGGALEKITMSESVTSVGNSAFAKCENLTEVELGAGVEYIGKNAFFGCTNLQAINVTGVDEIGASAFRNCTSLTEVNLLDVESVSPSLFNGCTSLQTVNIPNATEIGDEAFAKCSSLTEISLAKVTAIGESAFAYCTALEKVTMPAAIDEIGKYAFRRCETLNTISLPAVENLSAYVFEDCTSLETVYIAEGTKTIKMSAFRGCENLKRLYIPDSVVTLSGSLDSEDVIFVTTNAIAIEYANRNNITVVEP